MSVHQGVLSGTVNALGQFWQSQSIPMCPQAVGDVVATAQHRGLVLPPDFIHFYSATNGLNSPSVLGTDSNGFLLLPLEELRTEQRKMLVVADGSAVEKTVSITIFADYLQASWWYGLIAEIGSVNYQIGIMPVESECKVFTTSLADFLRLYIADDEILYDWGHPFSELGRSCPK
ncbi:MAG: hypothetical protein EOO62_15110 [Hymenobacter sp.]|nr:MAG: hypothetical protein EOO62_15110 [Hymenobacter sp.]